MKIGFIGLGNVGGKLAGSLLRNNFDITVRDLDETITNSLKDLGAKVAKSPKELAEQSDLIITRSRAATSNLIKRGIIRNRTKS